MTNRRMTIIVEGVMYRYVGPAPATEPPMSLSAPVILKIAETERLIELAYERFRELRGDSSQREQEREAFHDAARALIARALVVSDKTDANT